jgi:probable HAF family extracellular repeat protein
VVDLGVSGEATAVNDHGEVAGTSAGRAFVWRHGTVVELGTLGGTFSAATDINNHGDVVGGSDVAGGGQHAVLWRAGRTVDLGTLGGDYSYAYAVNDAGEVVGVSTLEPGNFLVHAFSWRDGAMTDLGVLSYDARAYDVNNRGQVVGDSMLDGVSGIAVIWQGGTVTPLLTRPAQPVAVNDLGQVAGSFWGNSPFLLDRGKVTELGRLSATAFTEPADLNNRGEVVGFSGVDAFLWKAGRMTALPRPDADFASAKAVNNRGQVAGYTVTSASDGFRYRAVLWTR